MSRIWNTERYRRNTNGTVPHPPTFITIPWKEVSVLEAFTDWMPRRVLMPDGQVAFETIKGQETPRKEMTLVLLRDGREIEVIELYRTACTQFATYLYDYAGKP